MNTVHFLGYTCKVEEHRYQENNRIALELVDEKTKEPIATATTNLGREPLEP